MSRFPQPLELTAAIFKSAMMLGRHTDQTLHRSLKLRAVEFRLLMVLRHKRLSQEDVAAFHGVTAAAVSRKIKGLLSRKLITRAIDPANRRRRILTLTPAGERMFQRAERTLATDLTKLLAKLRPAERRQLIHLHDRLVRVLQSTPSHA